MRRRKRNDREQVALDPLQRALEEALVADPDDVAAHMAYADWLSEQDASRLQARGEFIRTQLALEDANKPPLERQRLQERERALLAQHRESWLGPLARMFPLDQEPRQHAHFARGWIDSIRVFVLTVNDARALAQAPELRLLRRLVLLGCESELDGIDYPVNRRPHVDVSSAYPALSAFAEAKYFSNVRAFALGDCEGDCQFCTYPDAANLVQALGRFQKLLQLDLNAREVPESQLFEADFTRRLHTLRMERIRLRDAGVRQMARMAWPGLKVLQMWNARVTDTGARALARSKLVRKLELLDVSFNWLSPAGVEALRRSGTRVVAEYQMQAGEDHDNEYIDDGWGGAFLLDDSDEFDLDLE